MQPGKEALTKLAPDNVCRLSIQPETQNYNRDFGWCAGTNLFQLLQQLLHSLWLQALPSSGQCRLVAHASTSISGNDNLHLVLQCQATCAMQQWVTMQTQL